MDGTILESFNELISVYNEHRRVGNVSAAINVGSKIVSIAKGECGDPKVPAALKERYNAAATPVREWLAGIKMGIGGARVQTAGSADGDDKIKSRDWFDAGVPKLTLNDVAGLDSLRDEFMINVLAPASPKYSPIYHKYRKDVGLQILMYGPPGCGKTHIVKCLAGQLQCKIAVVQVKDVMQRLVGDGAKVIAEIFEQASRYDKCIIFFDEIDAIAASRDSDESRYTKEQLTTLLTNMDGFTSSVKPGQIRIVIAATNRPWVLDSAVKRGGRFDTQMYVPLPDFKARKKLIELALGKDPAVKNRTDVPCAPDVTSEWLATRFEGYAGADIKAACKQIVNRPLAREINQLLYHGRRVNDCVTRADCEEVIGKYINSITDQMLFEYDAYSANMEVNEYIAGYAPKAKEARAKGEALPAHVIRLLDEIDNK